MIHILEGTRQHVLSTKAIGTISSEDYNMLLSRLEQKLADTEDLRWYFEMEKLVGWESNNAPKQVFKNLPNPKNLKKVAIVGGLNFKDSINQILEVFPKAEIQFFEAYQKQEAITWAAK